MENIVFASQNKHKIREVKEIMTDYNIIPINEIGFVGDIVEDGKTFEENALIKCREIVKFLNEKNIDCKVLSDDSGLCVDALDGRPGVFSARYSGDHNDKSNRQKILSELADKTNRKANFTCVVVLMDKKYNYITGIGKTYGEITTEEHGNTSFGYDCIFKSEDLNKTFGEAEEEEKNIVSHRGRAIRDLLNKI